jgi:hypothetical protein
MECEKSSSTPRQVRHKVDDDVEDEKTCCREWQVSKHIRHCDCGGAVETIVRLLV